MSARVSFSILIVLLLAGALAVFDAASRTDAATMLGRSAAHTQTANAALLDAAQAKISGAWSNAAAWHGGAAEAQSWIASQQAALGAPGAEVLAAEAGARAVLISPVQPVSWMRLAALANKTGALCDAAGCLTRSWAAGPVIEAEPGCVRLRMSMAAGLMPDDSDPRFGAYVDSVLDRRSALACFRQMPEERGLALIERWINHY